MMLRGCLLCFVRESDPICKSETFKELCTLCKPEIKSSLKEMEDTLDKEKIRTCYNKLRKEFEQRLPIDGHEAVVEHCLPHRPVMLNLEHIFVYKCSQ